MMWGRHLCVFMSLNLNKMTLFLLMCTYGIIHLYLHSNIDRNHQVLLLFSWPSTLRASKIMAAFKISVLHKWPPEGFLPKEFSLHAQLNSYAAGKKNGTSTQLQRGRFSLHCEGIRFDSPTWFLFSSYFCRHCWWLCGDYISRIGALCSASGGIVTIPRNLFCRSSLSVLLKDSQSLLLMELISVCPALWDLCGQRRAIESVSYICKGLCREVRFVTSSVVL